jgi:hypothetical protein
MNVAYSLNKKFRISHLKHSKSYQARACATCCERTFVCAFVFFFFFFFYSVTAVNTASVVTFYLQDDELAVEDDNDERAWLLQKTGLTVVIRFPRKATCTNKLSPGRCFVRQENSNTWFDVNETDLHEVCVLAIWNSS